VNLSLFFIAAAFSKRGTSVVVHADYHTFAVVPKRTNSPFFDAVREGCEARAKKLNVTCLYTGPDAGGPTAPQRQVEIVQELLFNASIGQQRLDGLAIAVQDEEIATDLIAQVVQAGVNVFTFDSDAADSERYGYVGTDNLAFGRELAHVLLALQPNGGSYGIIAGGVAPNIQLRVDGVRQGLKRSRWIEVSNSPADAQGEPLVALDEMEKLVATNPGLGAIIPVGGWPMFEPEAWEDFVERHPNVTTVVGDALDVQIKLMNRGAADGLVGQLPFQMGVKIIDKLLELKTSHEKGIDPPFAKGRRFPTDVLNVLQIPQDLPPLVEDMNYIGYLRSLGSVFFGIIAFLSIACAAWTFWYRSNRVVLASQPPFLYMVCVGILILASSIIPLGIDDEKHSLSACSIACMSFPWLISIGFVTAFSALFSKTWRVVKLTNSARHIRRIKVTVSDVMVPFLVLMSLNVAVLLTWTIVDPLQYERRASAGTDAWNRVYRSYYGSCYDLGDYKGGAIPYVVPIIVINLTVIVIANIQAYRARHIETAYSESKYISLIMLSMLQAWVVGVPILALIRENPQATYVVMAMVIFATCMATLLFLFVPKIVRTNESVASTGTVDRVRQFTNPALETTQLEPSTHEWSISTEMKDQTKATTETGSTLPTTTKEQNERIEDQDLSDRVGGEGGDRGDSDC